MNFKVVGVIAHISEPMKFDSGAKKISMVIDTAEQYNNLYAFDLFKGADHVKYVDDFTKFNKVGDNVEVEFTINCKEYNGKYFNNLGIWKVTKLGTKATPTTDEVDDDLPF